MAHKKLHLSLPCVVLHNMMRTHQGGEDRVPNPGNYGEALQGGQTSTRTTTSLLQSYGGHWLGKRIGSEMCLPTTLGEEACIYQSFSGLLSFIFKTTNYSKKFYSKLVLCKCPTNFTTISSPFPTISKTLKKLKKRLLQLQNSS